MTRQRRRLARMRALKAERDALAGEVRGLVIAIDQSRAGPSSRVALFDHVAAVRRHTTANVPFR